MTASIPDIMREAMESSVTFDDKTPKPIINFYTATYLDIASAMPDLREWVEWFCVVYEIPSRIVPTCWLQHPGLVGELAAMWQAHRGWHVAEGAGDGPIAWHSHIPGFLDRAGELGKNFVCTTSGTHERSAKQRAPREVTVVSEAEWNEVAADTPYTPKPARWPHFPTSAPASEGSPL